MATLLPRKTDAISDFNFPIPSSRLPVTVSTPTSADSSSLKRKRPPKIEIPNVLQEIQTEKLIDFKASKENVSFCGFGFGVSSAKGKKKFMEDTHKIVSTSEGNPKKGFFGVYDGHGGKKAAEFVAENLHTNIFKMTEHCKESKAKEEAVKAGYLKTDVEFLKQGIGSGTCCVTALIEGQEIVVSNLGDCRAVLCRGGVAEVLTRDHRVELEDERRRIEDKGGYVEVHRGVWRVHGILSVSRSIGDAHLKEWVLAEPDTKILQLTADMDFLVLASDGLWDEVDNQEAVDTVTRLCRGEEKLGSSGDLQNDTDDDYGRVNISPSSKLRRISLIKQPRGTGVSTGYKKTLNSWNEEKLGEEKLGSSGDPKNDTDDDYGRVNISPSSKLRRISLIRQPRGTGVSTGYKKTLNSWNEAEDDFACENESPPSKSRRISLVKRVNMKKEMPTKESNIHNKSPPDGLLAACKELVNLAVRRGTLDDVTVMIIDLNHFRCNS